VDDQSVGASYLDHLTDSDLQLLVAASDRYAEPADLRGHPEAITELVGRPEVFEAVFGREAVASGRLVAVSPFLTFSVALRRVAVELDSVASVPERSGPRQRVPIFDAPQLRDFLDEPRRTLFLAELLTSFTRIATGRYLMRTRRGPRWRRFSELDLVRLAGLVDATPAAERPGVVRRLGDVALFLAGVFPDYTQTHALGMLDAARLLRAAGIAREEHDTLATAPAIELFEVLGARWYRHAHELAVVQSVQLDLVADVADRFRQARRVLNWLADHYLFPAGNPWFAPPQPGT
jgi:hypothetical protein